MFGLPLDASHLEEVGTLCGAIGGDEGTTTDSDSVSVFASSVVEPHPPSPTSFTEISLPPFSFFTDGTLIGFGAAARVAGFLPNTVKDRRAETFEVDFLDLSGLCNAFKLDDLYLFFFSISSVLLWFLR